MSKISQNQFDYHSLGINKEINEEIGKMKNTRINYIYARISKNSKGKNGKHEEKYKVNRSGQSGHKKPNLSSGENNEYKMVRKKNSNNISNNISNNSDISTDKEKKKPKNILKAKVIKNGSIHHIERVEIDLVSNEEVETIKNESNNLSQNIYENDNIILNKNNNQSNEYYDNINNKDNNISNGINDISIAVNMIESRWKNNTALIKETDLPIICDEMTRKKREAEIILNRWKENEKIINEDKLTIFNDNNIINKWIKKGEIINEINLNILLDEEKIKEIELNKNNNKWRNNIDIINGEKLSFIVDNIKIKEKEMNNIINRWINNNQSIIGENISFLVDTLKIKNKEMENRINTWKNSIKAVEIQNISYLVDKLKIQKNEIENRINIWNNNSQIIQNENISFLVDYLKIKEKENENYLNKWNNNIQIENKDILSIETIKDKNSFKYSEKQYIHDLIQNININDNNNINFFILNYDNNINNLNKINYKIIKPNNKKELESILYTYYNENKINIEKSDDLNKDNNLSQFLLNKNAYINPIFILNDEQVTQLYEEFNNKKEWNNISLNIAKEIEINYEIIEPYSPSEKNKDESNIKMEKINDLKLKGQNKLCEDFGDTTPLNMLQEKFYVYAVSRNIKFAIQSSQSSINFISTNSNNINKKNENKIGINHFSLWIERVDKLDSYKSSELNETSDKK